jgi:hypothetical protein
MEKIIAGTTKKTTLPKTASQETASQETASQETASQETPKKEIVVSKESTVLSAIEKEVSKRLSGNAKHGESLELKKYEIAFLCTKECDCTFAKFGSTPNVQRVLSEREDYPRGKYAISDGAIYRGMVKMRIWNDKKTMYAHYVNNVFHVWNLPAAIEKNAEITELKRIDALNVQRLNEEKEKQEKIDLAKKEGEKK